MILSNSKDFEFAQKGVFNRVEDILFKPVSNKMLNGFLERTSREPYKGPTDVISTAAKSGKLKDPLEEAKGYIEKNLSEEVTLEMVAGILGLNPSYFSQMFKKRTGETFVQYRIRQRMEKAKRLLEQPSCRITEISYEVGYSDHPHFTKTFKKYTGVSPSEYRLTHGSH